MTLIVLECFGNVDEIVTDVLEVAFDFEHDEFGLNIRASFTESLMYSFREHPVLLVDAAFVGISLFQIIPGKASVGPCRDEGQELSDHVDETLHLKLIIGSIGKMLFYSLLRELDQVEDAVRNRFKFIYDTQEC